MINYDKSLPIIWTSLLILSESGLCCFVTVTEAYYLYFWGDGSSENGDLESHLLHVYPDAVTDTVPLYCDPSSSVSATHKSGSDSGVLLDSIIWYHGNLVLTFREQIFLPNLKSMILVPLPSLYVLRQECFWSGLLAKYKEYFPS